MSDEPPEAGRDRFSAADDRVSRALEGTITRYQAMVRQVAYRHGFDDATVDEVYQEVRVRLWRALGTTERIAGVTTSYVYQAATTAALDVLRRRRARPTETLEMSGASRSIASRAPTPDALVVSAELADAVERAVAGLIESRRPVVRMYLKGHAQAEIAELLGWSPDKVRNLLYRGLADLRAALAAEGYGPGGGA